MQIPVFSELSGKLFWQKVKIGLFFSPKDGGWKFSIHQNMNRKMELDLSREMCHVCDGPIAKNLRTEKEWCINPACLICNVILSIPYKEKKE